jgi:ABC-type uncharacterized transport system substrate-binding protein
LKVLFFYFLFLNLIFSESEIPILLSSNSSSYITTLNSFQSKFEHPTKITFLSSLSEEEQENYFNEIEKNSTPFIITIGNQATFRARDNLKKTKIIFAYVNSPSANNFSIEKNLCGVHTDISIKEYFNILKEISPSVKKVVSFYSNKIGEYYSSEGEYYELQYDIDYRKIPVQNKNSILAFLESNKNDIDAIYLVNDPIYNPENFQIVSDFAKKNRVMLFSQIPFIVQLGANFSLTPFFSRVGIQLAEISKKVKSNEFDCRNSKGISLKEFFLSVNKEYSAESGILIPDSILKKAENSRLIAEAINSYEEGNIELSETIFDKVLKKDSKDIVANSYKSEIILQRKGINIDKLFIQAEEAFKKKNLSLARETYKKILSVQPNNQFAQDKYENLILLNSEQERQDGERLERNGQVLEAIKKYSNSISILPTNQRSKTNLDNLREKERKNIPAYSIIYIRAYNHRDYDLAEEGFKKILAINPNEKNASEYLKLTVEKKESMKKFETCILENDKKCKLIWQKKK